MRLRYFLPSLFVLLFTLFSVPAEAQCAMCKAVAESSTEGGSTVATGLNAGILYLMFFPYLLMAVIAYAMYRQKKKNSLSEEN